MIIRCFLLFLVVPATFSYVNISHMIGSEDWMFSNVLSGALNLLYCFSLSWETPMTVL